MSALFHCGPAEQQAAARPADVTVGRSSGGGEASVLAVELEGVARTCARTGVCCAMDLDASSFTEKVETVQHSFCITGGVRLKVRNERYLGGQ